MFARFSVKKPLTVFVAAILIIVLGVVSFSNMTPDLLPNMDFPYMIVVTTYPGASPEEVEEEVTKPVEQAVATLDHFKAVSSTSVSNYSMVMLELTDDADMDTMTVEVREKLDQIAGEWDDMVGNPSIMKINPNILPVMVAAVDQEGSDVTELTSFLDETLLNRLEGTDGIADISVSGGVTKEINILITKEKIDALNQSLRDDAGAEFEEAQTALNEGKEELLSNQQTVNSTLSSLRSQLNSLTASQNQLSSLNDTITELEQTKEELTTGIASLKALQEKGATLQAALETLPESSEEYQAAVAGLATVESALSESGLTLETLPAAISESEAALQQVEQGLSGIDASLSDMGITREEIPATLTEMSQGITALKDGISEAENGLTTIDSALGELSGQQEELSQTKEDTLSSIDVSDQITMDMISGILAAQNFSMPAGYTAEGDDAILIRVGDEITSLEELQNLVLFDLSGDGSHTVTLSDVAEIFIGDNAAETYARINGNDGIILSFTKQSTTATAVASENLRERFSLLSEEYEGLHFTPLMDQGDYIHLIIDSVLDNLLYGAVLAILILILFLKDLRPTFIIACSIPLSVVFAVVLMYFSGVTLNMISLSGLAVGVGMLVDNSVVVIENIYRLRREGVSPIKAAVAGATQVAGAITASTLTTVCVFLPIVFVDGITRQLFNDMALTIGYSLVASLIVALTLVPAMATGMLKQVNTKPGRLFDGFIRGYEKSVRFALSHRGLVLAFSVVLLFASAFLALRRGFSFMPNMEAAQVTVTYTPTEDMSFEETTGETDQILDRIAQIEGVETVGAIAGSSGVSVLSLSSSGAGNDVTIYVIPKEGASAKEIAGEINGFAEEFPGTLTAVGESDMNSMISAMGSGVSIRLYGNDLDALKDGAAMVSETLSGISGIEEVNDGIEDATPELRITVDKNKAILKGLTVAQVYAAITDALTDSASGGNMNIDGSALSVTIRDDTMDTLTKDALEQFTLTVTDNGGNESEVLLSDVADITEDIALSSISRSNQRRYLTVSATVKEGNNVSLVTADAEKALSGLSLPQGVSWESSGENETIMDAMYELVKMFLLAVILVYGIMVAQFQSLLSPFIVLLTIPLALTGGLLGLLISGLDVSVISMIGFVMLAGIIVNNGIVLVDYINQLRASGVEKREAIVEAGKTRMRPILMTALTTILALVITAVGVGVGAEMMQPIAIVCIGGLTYATLMTLYVVPALYDLLNRKELRVVTDEDMEYETKPGELI